MAYLIWPQQNVYSLKALNNRSRSASSNQRNASSLLVVECGDYNLSKMRDGSKIDFIMKESLLLHERESSHRTMSSYRASVTYQSFRLLPCVPALLLVDTAQWLPVMVPMYGPTDLQANRKYRLLGVISNKEVQTIFKIHPRVLI